MLTIDRGRYLEDLAGDLHGEWNDNGSAVDLNERLHFLLAQFSPLQKVLAFVKLLKEHQTLARSQAMGWMKSQACKIKTKTTRICILGSM
jgi:hypothetical protein